MNPALRGTPSARAFSVVAGSLSAGWERIRGSDAVLLTFFASVFVGLCLQEPLAPGAMYGMLEPAMISRLIEQVRDRGLLDTWRAGGFPLRLNGYHGMSQGYLVFPLVWFFGSSWVLLRFWFIAVGVGILGVTYYFVRDCLGRGTACWTLLLLVLHPAFMMGIRNGSESNLAMLLLSMGTLLSLSRWWRTGRTGYFSAGGFCLGLGLWSRLYFLWFAGALGAATLLFHRRVISRFLEPGRRRALVTALAGAAAVALGASMLIVAEWKDDFLTAKVILRALTDPETEHGAAHYSTGLSIAAKTFADMLSSRAHFENFFSGQEQPAANGLYTGLFWASFLVCAAAGRSDRRLAALAAVFMVMFLQTPVSPSKPAEALVHLYFFYPLIQIIIAAAVVVVWKSRPTWKRGRALLAVVLGVVLFGEVRVMRVYQDRLARWGGLKVHSMAIYELGDWFRVGNQKNRRVGFLYNRDPWQLRYLLGRNMPARPFQRYGDFAPADWREDDLLVVHNGNEELFERWKVRFRPVKIFYDALGTPAYLIGTLESRPGPSASP